MLQMVPREAMSDDWWSAVGDLHEQYQELIEAIYDGCFDEE